ncbi:hypothetical protein, partial [Enterobacter cloacae complex sp. P4RS]|uniref:hypothetical protein n=1 Tax=Enterobacter cloacae complex sp. P4RS TaxID=2779590 RepID=UPI001D0BED12
LKQQVPHDTCWRFASVKTTNNIPPTKVTAHPSGFFIITFLGNLLIKKRNDHRFFIINIQFWTYS